MKKIILTILVLIPMMVLAPALKVKYLLSTDQRKAEIRGYILSRIDGEYHNLWPVNALISMVRWATT